jgi:hypothetical protein
MKFRNYCIIAMGKMDGIKNDIVKVAESKPRYIDAKGILIATFSSVVEPSELKDFLNFNNRSFFLFDLNENNSGCHLDNEKLNHHLFGYLMDTEDKLKDMSDRLADAVSDAVRDRLDDVGEADTEYVSATTRNSGYVKPIRSKKSGIKLTNMSNKDKETLLNGILDKGFKKITESDMKILKKLSDSK